MVCAARRIVKIKGGRRGSIVLPLYRKVLHNPGRELERAQWFGQLTFGYLAGIKG
jgi:hypothetical protein